MVRDPEKVLAILKGDDHEFDLIVIPRLNEFKDKNPTLSGWKELAKARKGRRRVFYLIGSGMKELKAEYPIFNKEYSMTKFATPLSSWQEFVVLKKGRGRGSSCEFCAFLWLKKGAEGGEFL